MLLEIAITFSDKEKNKYAMPSNEIHGYGKGYIVSEEQTLDWEIIEAYASEVKRVGEALVSSLFCDYEDEEEACSS
ncbi:unnamed protein product [Sphenostylis stenocarpa]|uniref:Uncharacterized protein n=1 Tax=Sphenostylis stenocarpa TaxID=92480 RepID=A0AA86RZG6_9FABA|nr:unnamed protein product [Sphenostylis stenocarpa]